LFWNLGREEAERHLEEWKLHVKEVPKVSRRRHRSPFLLLSSRREIRGGLRVGRLTGGLRVGRLTGGRRMADVIWAVGFFSFVGIVGLQNSEESLEEGLADLVIF
jgi:hypothetical protein